jgi:DNA-binding LacI/PurR family transcriptional regulator
VVQVPGVGAAVHCHCLNDDGDGEALQRAARQRHGYGVIVKAFKVWEREAPPEYLHEVKAAREWLILYKMADAELYYRSRELFAAALRNRAVTAWVLANDAVAVMARDYLSRRRIRVPRDISLIGFDDSVDAMKYRITSYNFNIAQVVHAMVHHVVTCGRLPTKRRLQPVEIEGIIVERVSTARPGRRQGAPWRHRQADAGSGRGA